MRTPAKNRNQSFRGGEQGFTLIEATVALLLLLIVLMTSFLLLFNMKSFAQRQQYFADARQTARRAVDYLSYYVRGASDMNNVNTDRPSPNALVAWVQNGSTAIPVSFNNIGAVSGVTDPATVNTSQTPPVIATNAVADKGTDLINIAYATSSIAVPILGWSSRSGSFDLDYRQGCPNGGAGNDTANLLSFEQLTGCVGVGCNGSSGTGTMSGVLQLVNSSGQWGYYMVTSYATATGTGAGCAGVTNLSSPQPGAVHVIRVGTTAGRSISFDAPGTYPSMASGTLMAGVQFYSFRVYNHQLQQKAGLFDETTDTPGTAYQVLLDNIDDFQVAYIYNDGTLWNNVDTNQLPKAASGSITTSGREIPYQGTTDAKDATNLRALRITVVARSSVPMSSTEIKPKAVARYPLLAAEDHTPTQPTLSSDPINRYYRYRLSATLMLRSRSLGY